MNNLPSLVNPTIDVAITLEAKGSTKPQGIIDRRLIDLLLAVEETKSVRSACERLAYSPRNAQRILKKFTEGCGLRLLKHHGSHGTELSEEARWCIALYASVCEFAEHEVRQRKNEH